MLDASHFPMLNDFVAVLLARNVGTLEDVEDWVRENATVLEHRLYVLLDQAELECRVALATKGKGGVPDSLPLWCSEDTP